MRDQSLTGATHLLIQRRSLIYLNSRCHQSHISIHHGTKILYFDHPGRWILFAGSC